MKKLIAFGDSWTHGHGVETDPVYKEIGRADDFTFNLRMSNSWPRWLADKLDLPYINFGYPGIDNLQILNLINMFLDKITKDDLILVMLSFPYRHTFKHETKDVSLEYICKKLQNTLKGYNYYILNSFCQTFYEEPELKDSLDLSKFLAVDMTAADVLINYERENNISVWEYGSRKVYKDRTNFEEGDYHPNLLGYKVIADWIFNELQKKIN